MLLHTDRYMRGKKIYTLHGVCPEQVCEVLQGVLTVIYWAPRRTSAAILLCH